MIQAKREAEKIRKQIEKKKSEDRKSGLGMEERHSSISYGSGSNSSSSRSTFAAEPVVETKKYHLIISLIP